jgi:hypothetical protein
VDDGQSRRNQAGSIRGTRSAGFPALSLPEAVAIVKTAGNNGRKHAITAMAAYAGHTTPNSGPFRQKLAALKDWGFVTSTAEAVTLTEAGMGVALPSSPETALDIMRSAFQGCSIFWAIYTEAAKGVPLYPSSIGNVAVTAHGVAVRSKETFIKSFIDSAVVVGLAEKLPNGEVKLHAAGMANTEATVADDRALASVPQEAVPPATATRTAPLEPLQSELPVVNQVWKDERVRIVLKIDADAPLSATAFMQIGAVTTAIEALYEIVRAGD